MCRRGRRECRLAQVGGLSAKVYCTGGNGTTFGAQIVHPAVGEDIHVETHVHSLHFRINTQSNKHSNN